MTVWIRVWVRADALRTAPGSTYVGELVYGQDAVAQRRLVAHAHQERQDDLVPGRLVPLLQVPARNGMQVRIRV